uniref:Multicopper oxidase n=1 Tax=Ganoderma boninense TaxID=34458 RepID=A0A5K1K3D3_9APHY|nr:Multicopper oxidase [Ganoderma boninense]
MAFAARREGRPAPPTVYGRLEYDLSTSFGPVPITFSHEPQNNVPANRAARPPMPWTPSRTGSPASQLAIDLAGRRSADPTRRSATSPPALPPPQMLNAPSSSPPSQLAIDLAGRRSADPTGRRSAASPPIPPPAHVEQMPLPVDRFAWATLIFAVPPLESSKSATPSLQQFMPRKENGANPSERPNWRLQVDSIYAQQQ